MQVAVTQLAIAVLLLRLTDIILFNLIDVRHICTALDKASARILLYKLCVSTVDIALRWYNNQLITFYFYSVQQKSEYV